MNDLTKQETKLDPAILENIALKGDLSGLNSQQKVAYYCEFCKSLGLNPLTKPFQIIRFQGKEILYASKDCTEQLRKINGVSITKLEKLFQNDLYLVTAYVQDKNGRQDASTGAVSMKGLSGDALANSIMKSETKAKRRATLSICGLGILDDSETDTIGKYQKIDVLDGDIIETKTNADDYGLQMASAEQLKQIVELASELGFKDKEEIIKEVNMALAANFKSSKELTNDDANRVIKAFKESISFNEQMSK